jgi:GNAT superfamily N-acetyltransferase
MMSIRRAVPADAPALIVMMRALAAFEGYLDQFAVSESDLLARAFGPAAQCFILLAESNDGAPAGYAVYLVQPYTYDLRQNVTLKELFVAQSQRGQGVAMALLEQLRTEARALNAGRILWLVLPSNQAAKRLYRRFGGAIDGAWEHWQLTLD